MESRTDSRRDTVSAGEAGNLTSGWPCDGPLLRLAHGMAERLLPAFDTTTGMPYGTVNLRYGEGGLSFVPFFS